MSLRRDERYAAQRGKKFPKLVLQEDCADEFGNLPGFTSAKKLRKIGFTEEDVQEIDQISEHNRCIGEEIPIRNIPNGFRNARDDPTNTQKEPIPLIGKRDDPKSHLPALHKSISGVTYAWEFHFRPGTTRIARTMSRLRVSMTSPYLKNTWRRVCAPTVMLFGTLNDHIRKLDSYSWALVRARDVLRRELSVGESISLG